MLQFILGSMIIIGGQFFAQFLGHAHFEIKKETKILDLGFELIPFRKVECLYNILPIGLSFCCLSLSADNSFVRDLSFFFVLRGITVALTIFPAPMSTKNQWIKVFLIGGDYDKMFSGHMGMAYLASRHLSLHWIITTAVVSTEFLLLCMSRAHFTADLVVSIIIAELLFRVNFAK